MTIFLWLLAIIVTTAIAVLITIRISLYRFHQTILTKAIEDAMDKGWLNGWGEGWSSAQDDPHMMYRHYKQFLELMNQTSKN